MNEFDRFAQECNDEIRAQGADERLEQATSDWFNRANAHKYSYHFTWLGRPIIQYPQDIVAMQEIIWSVRPDLIVEAGIAHGGSLIFYASMLELIAACGGSQDARVLGIDIDIRPHNRQAIESHAMFRRISMIEGSSIAPDVIAKVKGVAADRKRILVCLDSSHTHDHVLAEMHAYAPLVSVGSYCVVFDTVIDRMPAGTFGDRPWGPKNNPRTAVKEFLENHPEFEIDRQIDSKLLISVAPDGYLRRVS